MLSKRQLKRLQSLHHRRGRAKHRLFLIEGPRLVHEALLAGWPLREAFFESRTNLESIQRLAGALEAGGVPTFPITAGELEVAADAVTPQGILATAELPESPADFAPGEDDGAPILVVDGVQEPGNVGALLRTADAYAISPVLLTRGCADPFGPKAVRGAMGAHFHLRVIPDVVPGTDLVRLRERGYRLVAAVARGGEDPAPCGSGRWALAVGGEGGGLSPAVLDVADQRVTIGTPGRAESLNVAVAAGILLDRLLGGGAGLPPASNAVRRAARDKP